MPHRPCRLRRPITHRHIPRRPRGPCTPLCCLLCDGRYARLDIRVFLDDVAVVATRGLEGVGE